jgi:hypothetical protein
MPAEIPPWLFITGLVIGVPLGWAIFCGVFDQFRD